MSDLPDDKLELLIYLSKELDDVSFYGGCLFGNYIETSSFSFVDVKSKLENLNLYRNDSENEFEINLTDNFFKDLKDYLEKSERRLLDTIPDTFYIFEFDFLCEDKNFTNAPIQLLNFYNMARFFESICRVSDYVNSYNSDKSCIFHFKEQVEVTNNYDVEKLVSLNNLDGFIDEFIEDSIHKEQKRGIVRNVIFEMYNDKIDISTIAKDFDQFFKKVRDGYELYVSEFSFESFKNELDDLKRDYILKINKIFTDVQNQILAIPLATIVATSQMKKFNNDYSNVFINVFILLGVFLFSFILKMVINNQYNSLELIRDELDFKLLKIRSLASGSHKENFKNTIEHLIDRNEEVERNIGRILVILYVSILVSLIVFVFRFFY